MVETRVCAFARHFHAVTSRPEEEEKAVRTVVQTLLARQVLGVVGPTWHHDLHTRKSLN